MNYLQIKGLENYFACRKRICQINTTEKEGQRRFQFNP